TVEGEWLRGYGIAAFGAGHYNFFTSMALANVVDSMMRVDQYGAALNQAAVQRSQARLARIHQRVRVYWDAIHERMLWNPTQFDIDRGDTLNLLVQRIAATRIPYSGQRITGINLPGETLDSIPL